MAGGFRPFQDFSGHPYSGKTQTFDVLSSHSTLLAVGDLVARQSTSNNLTGRAYVDAGVAGSALTGPIVAIGLSSFQLSDLDQKGLPASTAGQVIVAVGDDLLMEAEFSNGSIAVTDVGLNFDIVATAATSSGNLVNSNMTVNATGGGTGTAQVRLMALPVDLFTGAVDLGAGITGIFRIVESTEYGATGS